MAVAFLGGNQRAAVLDSGTLASSPSSSVQISEVIEFSIPICKLTSNMADSNAILTNFDKTVTQLSGWGSCTPSTLITSLWFESAPQPRWISSGQWQTQTIKRVFHEIVPGALNAFHQTQSGDSSRISFFGKFSASLLECSPPGCFLLI